MSRILPLFAVAVLAALASPAFAQKAPAAKKLYCWTEGGRKVCGDALPANAVDSERTEINAKSGLPTAHLPRALNDAERESAQAQAERERLAAMEREATRRREMAMVESYASETELRRAYENRLALSAGTLKASQMAVSGLRLSLVNLLQRANEAELTGKPVAAPLAQNIRRQHDELQRQQRLLAQLQREADEIEGEFEDTLARYRALKTPPAAMAAAQG